MPAAAGVGETPSFLTRAALQPHLYKKKAIPAMMKTTPPTTMPPIAPEERLLDCAAAAPLDSVALDSVALAAALADVTVAPGG